MPGDCGTSVDPFTALNSGQTKWAAFLPFTRSPSVGLECLAQTSRGAVSGHHAWLSSTSTTTPHHHHRRRHQPHTSSCHLQATVVGLWVGWVEEEEGGLGLPSTDQGDALGQAHSKVPSWTQIHRGLVSALSLTWCFLHSPSLFFLPCRRKTALPLSKAPVMCPRHTNMTVARNSMCMLLHSNAHSAIIL